MADDNRYSFITVSSDDDDDVVIQAGVPADSCVPAPSDEDSPVVCEPAVAQVVSPQPASKPVAVKVVKTNEVSQAAVDAPASPSASGVDHVPQPTPRSAKKEYRETTLEDLESAPMGGTQKVIIAAAIVGVLAFIAYYVFF